MTVAVSLQIGVNYSNDYSDGVRGTDDFRVGPVRLTGSGAVEPGLVKRAAIVSFGVAVVAGGALVILSGAFWLAAVGALALWAAWTYTGGTRPYGYRGLGEIVVFVFFGPVATRERPMCRRDLSRGRILWRGQQWAFLPQRSS